MNDLDEDFCTLGLTDPEGILREILTTDHDDWWIGAEKRCHFPKLGNGKPQPWPTDPKTGTYASLTEARNILRRSIRQTNS